MYSDFRGGKKKMLNQVHKLLSEADAVIHYNGRRFDIPTLNKEFLEAGMKPPATYKQIDLLDTAKKEFRFPSNKLDYVAQRLGLGKKFEHEGHMLWISCMNNDPKAWKRMELYNRHDVTLLGRLYDRLLPWMKTHANHNLYSEAPECCPNCGSTRFQQRGLAMSKTLSYQRYQCQGCGSWFRSRTSHKAATASLVAI
jgi:DNA polymerase elongation subunit (family B)